LANRTKIEVEVEALTKGFDELKNLLKLNVDLGGLDKLKDANRAFDALKNRAESFKASTKNMFSQVFSKADIAQFKASFQSITDLKARPGGEDFFSNLTAKADSILKARQMVALAKEWLTANKGIADPAMITSVKSLANSWELQAHGMKQGSMSIRNFSVSMGLLKTEIKDLIFWQTRWYATKALVFAPFQIGQQIFTEGANFAKMVSEWEGKLLRWSATSGKVTEEVKENIKSLVVEIRKAAIDAPVPFEEIAKAAESFIGAGIPEKVVKSIVPQLAQLRTAFPEINAEQFGVAITGVYNSLKDSMKGASDEGKIIIDITEKLLRAQAKGIIRPEQFTQVIQHLGEMSRQAGFTVDEMLSLSVLVTDLGSRAGNAARSLRGMMESLMKSASVDKLKQLGVEIRKDQTLAEQFVPIMKKLRESLGEPGAKSLGALQALGKIFPVERVKSVTAAIDFLDKYLMLVDDIGKAQGGLSASSSVVLATVTGQLGILSNRWKELTGTIFTSNGALSETVSILNDMVLGALLSVGDKAVLANHRITELGSAGKTVYVAFELLSGSFTFVKTGFEAVWKVIGPLVEGFRNLSEMILGTGETLKLLAQIITTVLLAALGKKIALFVLGTNTIRTFIGILGSIPAMLTSLSFALKMFYATNIPIFLAIMGLAGIIALIEKQKTSQKAPGYEAQASAQYVLGKSDTMLEGTVEERLAGYHNLINEEEKLLIQHEQNLEKAKEGEEQFSEILGPTKVQTATESDLWSLEQKVEASKLKIEAWKKSLIGLYNTEEEKKKFKDIPDLTPKKSRFPGELSDLNKKYSEEIRVIKEGEKQKQNELEAAHKLQLINDDDFYNESLTIAMEANTDEYNSLVKQVDDLNKLYRKQNPKDAQQAEAIWNDYENKYDELMRRLLELDTDTQKKILDNEVNTELKRREILNRRLNFEADMTKIEFSRAVDLANFQIDEEKKVRDFLYGKKEYDTQKYYQEEMDSIKAKYDLELKLADKEWENWKKRNEDKMERAQEVGGDLAVAMWQESELEEQKSLDRKEKAWQIYFGSIAELGRKASDDLRRIFDTANGGFSGSWAVTKKTFGDLSRNTLDMAQNVADAITTISSSMESAFMDFLDHTSEGFLDWKKLVTSIINDITKELIRVYIVKQLIGGIQGMLGGSSSGNAGMNWNGAWSDTNFGGSFANGGSVALNKAYLVGERGPELFVPGSNGTIVPNGATAQPIVNVYNNNGSNISTNTRKTNQGIEIDVLIDNAVAKKLNQFGSSSNKTMRHTFGAQPVLVSR